MHVRNRTNWKRIIHRAVQFRRKLLQISPLRLTNTIVHCASRVIVFHAMIIYFHALFLSPISEVTLPLFSLPKSTSPNPLLDVMLFTSSQRSSIPDYRSSFYRCNRAAFTRKIQRAPEFAYNIPSFSHL